MELRYSGHLKHKPEKNPGEAEVSFRIITILCDVGWMDEITVQQQPRGSYTLDVFKGNLAVGGECVYDYNWQA